MGFGIHISNITPLIIRQISEIRTVPETAKKYVLEDDGSENLGEPMTIKIPAENIDQLQYESETKQVSLNTKIDQVEQTP